MIDGMFRPAATKTFHLKWKPPQGRAIVRGVKKLSGNEQTEKREIRKTVPCPRQNRFNTDTQKENCQIAQPELDIHTQYIHTQQLQIEPKARDNLPLCLNLSEHMVKF